MLDRCAHGRDRRVHVCGARVGVEPLVHSRLYGCESASGRCQLGFFGGKCDRFAGFLLGLGCRLELGLVAFQRLAGVCGVGTGGFVVPFELRHAGAFVVEVARGGVGLAPLECSYATRRRVALLLRRVDLCAETFHFFCRTGELRLGFTCLGRSLVVCALGTAQQPCGDTRDALAVGAVGGGEAGDSMRGPLDVQELLLVTVEAFEAF